MVLPNIAAHRFNLKQAQHQQQITSALFIVNRSSGAGHTRQTAKLLENHFYNQFQPDIPHCLYDEDIFVVPTHIRFEVAPSIHFVTGGG